MFHSRSANATNNVDYANVTDNVDYANATDDVDYANATDNVNYVKTSDNFELEEFANDAGLDLSILVIGILYGFLR